MPSLDHVTGQQEGLVLTLCSSWVITMEGCSFLQSTKSQVLQTSKRCTYPYLKA